jgi:hypothetical protein
MAKKHLFHYDHHPSAPNVGASDTVLGVGDGGLTTEERL